MKLPRDQPANTFIEIPEECEPLRRDHIDNASVRRDFHPKEFHIHGFKNVRANTHDK